MQTTQNIVADVIRQHGGPDSSEWLQRHEVDKPTDGDTLKLAYCKDPARPAQRMKQRTGRFIRAHLWPDVADTTLQAVGAAIDAALWGEDTSITGEGPVRELRGEDIRYAYLMSNSGIRSCMATADAQPYLDIYVDNPDSVCLLFARMDNGAARALAWTFPDGSRYRDRVYHTSDSAREVLLAYAEKHGISSKLPHRSIEVDIKDGPCGYWPYMDTFTGMDILSSTRCRLMPSRGEYQLTQTDGTCVDDSCHCEACGERIEYGEGCDYNGYTYCDDCFSEQFTVCDHCGEAVLNGDCNYLENLKINVCDHCRDHHYTLCDLCNCWDRNENTWELDTNRADLENVCDDCYHERVRTCVHCGDDFDKEAGGGLTPEGELCCEECYDEQYTKCPTCGATHSKAIGCEDCDADRMYHTAILPSENRVTESIPEQVPQGAR